MYDKVYELFVKHGYGEKMQEPSFFGKARKEIVSGYNGIPFENLVDVKYIRPDLVFVADKCSTNTNMSKEKLSADNDKYLHTKRYRVSVPACTSDTHFITMGLTAVLTGEPVCCVCIVQKSTVLTFIERYGFDIDAKWEVESSVFDEVKEKLSSFRSNNKYKGLRHCSKELAKEDLYFDIPPELLKRTLVKGKFFQLVQCVSSIAKKYQLFLPILTQVELHLIFWLKS